MVLKSILKEMIQIKVLLSQSNFILIREEDAEGNSQESLIRISAS